MDSFSIPAAQRRDARIRSPSLVFRIVYIQFRHSSLSVDSGGGIKAPSNAPVKRMLS